MFVCRVYLAVGYPTVRRDNVGLKELINFRIYMGLFLGQLSDMWHSVNLDGEKHEQPRPYKPNFVPLQI